jgi:hypothetical protein
MIFDEEMCLFSRLAALRADRRHASMKETPGHALAKIKYH